MIVPFLRQDLQLLPGSSSEHGSPTWLLYDVLRNKYFFSALKYSKQLVKGKKGRILSDFIHVQLHFQQGYSLIFIIKAIRVLFFNKWYQGFYNPFNSSN